MSTPWEKRWRIFEGSLLTTIMATGFHVRCGSLNCRSPSDYHLRNGGVCGFGAPGSKNAAPFSRPSGAVTRSAIKSTAFFHDRSNRNDEMAHLGLVIPKVT